PISSVSSVSYQNFKHMLPRSPTFLALVFGAASLSACGLGTGSTSSASASGGGSDTEAPALPGHYWLHCFGQGSPGRFCVPDPDTAYCVGEYTKQQLCGHHYLGDQNLDPDPGYWEE